MKVYESGSSSRYRLILFLIFPFYAFLESVKHLRVKSHFWIVFLFALFFCYTFIPIPNSDATRYEERLSSLDSYTISQYISDLGGMYNGKGMYEDAYIYTIQLFVSPLTSDIRLYRTIFGFIYFMIFLSLLRKILNNVTNMTNEKNWFFFGLVFLISFTSGINGVRWPLALMSFLLFTYRYLLDPSVKNLSLVLIPVFIHFSFFYSILFFLVYVLSRRIYNPKIAFFLVFLTYILSASVNNSILNNTNVLGEGIEDKVVSYSNESYGQRRLAAHSQLNWYVQFNRTIPNYFVLISVLLTTYFGNRIYKSYLTQSLQYLTLLNFIAAFLSSQIIDQTSNRFSLVATGIGFIYLFHLYNENHENKLVKRLSVLYVPILVVTVLVQFRTDLFCVSPNLIIGNIFIETIYSFDVGIETILGF